MQTGVDLALVASCAGAFVVALLALAGIASLVVLMRRRQASLDTLTPLTFVEVSTRLNQNGLSLVEKRELLARFNGQRVRWPGIFDKVSQPRYGQCLFTVPHEGSLRGNIFFGEFGGGDMKQLERMHEGTPVVVEGTVNIDEKWLNIELLRAVLRERESGQAPR